MSRTATYHTTVQWKGEHWGHIRMGNGPEMDFSAPPDAHGHAGVLTPEDAFVAAVNTCVMMMFIWATERFKLDLVSYDCGAEGTKLIELDRTEIFTSVALRPRIVVRAAAVEREAYAQARSEGPGKRREIQPGGELPQVGDHHRTRNRDHSLGRYARGMQQRETIALPKRRKP